MTIFVAVWRTTNSRFPKGRFWPFRLLRRSEQDTQRLNSSVGSGAETKISLHCLRDRGGNLV